MGFSRQEHWSGLTFPSPKGTLCNPMDCSLPGSYIHGIFQARVLEWVAISFSIYSLSKLQLFNVVLSTILNTLCQILRLYYLITGSLYSFINFSLYAPTWASGNHLLNYCFYEFFFFLGNHKWYCAIFFFLYLVYFTWHAAFHVLFKVWQRVQVRMGE